METVEAEGRTWPNLDPTWEVFLEEAERCSEQGRIYADPSPNQNLHDGGSSILSDFTNPSPATTHTHAGLVNSDGGDGMMVPAALYNSCLILSLPGRVLRIL